MEEQWFVAIWTAFNWKEWIAFTRVFQKSNLLEMKKKNRYDDWDITYMYIFYFTLRQSESACLNNYNMALHTGVPSE